MFGILFNIFCITNCFHHENYLSNWCECSRIIFANVIKSTQLTIWARLITIFHLKISKGRKWEMPRGNHLPTLFFIPWGKLSLIVIKKLKIMRRIIEKFTAYENFLFNMIQHNFHRKNFSSPSFLTLFQVCLFRLWWSIHFNPSFIHFLFIIAQRLSISSVSFLQINL